MDMILPRVDHLRVKQEQMGRRNLSHRHLHCGEGAEAVAVAAAVGGSSSEISASGVGVLIVRLMAVRVGVISFGVS